jgi:arsenite-transporting ATPase
MNPEIQFFIGKGGVGKSTTSAVTAIHFAQNDRDTLLVSMDPAHNQCDIFQEKFSERPKRVADHLEVKEVDIDFWIETYLKKTEKTIKQTYTYESAFNLQNYFNILQFSPGLEEYALLLAFENVLHTYGNKDIIIFDMAPTALTLRFFCLPSITLIWMEELLKLRNQIYAKKEIISKIKVFGKEIEQDKIKDRLNLLIHEYEHLRDHFLAEKTRINLVMNDDELSFSEAFRIKLKLKDIGIDIDAVVVNKMQHMKIPERVKDEFNTQKIALFPLSAIKLLGYEVLSEYINSNPKAFLSN